MLRQPVIGVFINVVVFDGNKQMLYVYLCTTEWKVLKEKKIVFYQVGIHFLNISNIKIKFQSLTEN
jgi:hypothetical protein